MKIHTFTFYFDEGYRKPYSKMVVKSSSYDRAVDVAIKRKKAMSELVNILHIECPGLPSHEAWEGSEDEKDWLHRFGYERGDKYSLPISRDEFKTILRAAIDRALIATGKYDDAFREVTDRSSRMSPDSNSFWPKNVRNWTNLLRELK